MLASTPADAQSNTVYNNSSRDFSAPAFRLELLNKEQRMRKAAALGYEDAQASLQALTE